MGIVLEPACSIFVAWKDNIGPRSWETVCMFMFRFQTCTKTLEFQTVVLAKKIRGYLLCFFCIWYFSRIYAALPRNWAKVKQIAQRHVLCIWAVVKPALEPCFIGCLEYTASVVHWPTSLPANVWIKTEILLFDSAELCAASFAAQDSRYLRLLLSFNISISACRPKWDLYCI